MLPNLPFETSDFSPKGGGIDFLGLRWVNLTMVATDLIPEINNVTRDMGTFFIGAWIPWKFRQLCKSERDYTEKNYRIFREKVEVALSLTMRDDMDIEREWGKTRNRIGITQQCKLPGELSFQKAKRKDQNSLYAAAIYGPSLRALGFVKSYESRAKQGAKGLNITVHDDEHSSLELVRGVESSIAKTKAYNLLGSLDSETFSRRDICRLAEAGLDPAKFRGSEFEPLKAIFRKRLLPDDADDPGYARTLTARLALSTLRQKKKLSFNEIRTTWYTGLFDNGNCLRIPDPELAEHRQKWACFLARQYQRYAIELLLWCFEDALRQGCNSIDLIVDHWIKRSDLNGRGRAKSFGAILQETGGDLFGKSDHLTSLAWNEVVTAADTRFEWIDDPKDDNAVSSCLRMLAAWYWRTLSWRDQAVAKPLFNLGGADRMSMTWFQKWLKKREGQPINVFLRDIFSGLIFGQHMRIALARFDGNAQRIRFMIGDNGVEPTLSAKNDLAKLALPWMPDRLDTLFGLLCDCDVLSETDGFLRPGKASLEI